MHVRSIRLVIFDCDGVLVDSERITVQVEQEYLRELGWDLSVEEIVDRFVGRSEADFQAGVAERLGLPADWHRAYEHRYTDAFHDRLQAVDGIEAALDVLTVPTAVASSGSHEKMRQTLGLTGLWDRFEGRITSATEVPRGKPHPDVFLLAASRMGVAPNDCAVVEDSANGVTAARAAGMRVLGYAGGVTPANRLQHATRVFTDMRDLPQLLTELATAH